MAVKLESQDKNKPKKKSSVVHVNFNKKANPYEVIMTDELKYTPVPAHLLRRSDEEVPVIHAHQLKSAKAVKETTSKTSVASTTRSKGDIFDNDPPFEPPYESQAANDGDLCQDLNPRLKAWLASFCPIPANVCWLDRPSEYYRKRTESSEKVRKKVGHQKPVNKKYCYTPLNPVLGWRGLRPPTVNDLIQRAYKDGKSFLSPAQRRNIYGEQMLGKLAPYPSLPAHTPFSQGAKLDQSDRECAEAHVHEWLDHWNFLAEEGPVPADSKEDLFETDYELPQEDKSLKAYKSCEEHIRLCMWLHARRNNPCVSHSGKKFPVADTTHLWCEQEREFERYKEVLFVMQYTTPHIDYLPNAVDLEIEGQLMKAGNRHLGWYIGAIAPPERFFKRTDREGDPLWKSFCFNAAKYRTGEISLEKLEEIGKYIYRRHRRGLEARTTKPWKSPYVRKEVAPSSGPPERLKNAFCHPIATTANDSEFLSTIVASKYRKKIAEQRICEERAIKDALSSGHESRPAAEVQHLVLARGWKKLGSLLVPPGYDETTGRIVVPPPIEVHDADKLIRLKTG